MIANYGYTDAEGEFYITIDTGLCAKCVGHPCAKACPRDLFIIEEDPYGEVGAAIDSGKSRKLKDECAGCKPEIDRRDLPCVAACIPGALRHSW